MFHRPDNPVRFVAYFASIFSAVTGSLVVPRDDGLDFDSIPASISLVWHSCSSGYSCAVLDVPLDYTIPAGARARLPLLKIPAASTVPYMGMVFVNPGGPGLSVIDDFVQYGYGTKYASIIGSNYDVVAYEPRGIGHSIPLATCSTPRGSKLLRSRIFNQPYGPRLPSKFYEDEYTFMRNLGTICKTNIGGTTDIGRHMSTAIVVRDAYAASNSSFGVSNPSYFNFWGFSYGSTIGQTFAMMFPNQVGRFVLDGINDSEDYYGAIGEKNIYLADLAFSTFFTYCNKAGPTGPNNCSYHTGLTSHDIFQRFERTVLRLDTKKANQENWSNKTAIAQGLQALKLVIAGAVYSPLESFPGLADTLKEFESIVQNITTLDSLGVYQYYDFHVQYPEWGTAIFCSDTGNVLSGQSLQQLQPRIEKAEKQSWVFGELFITKAIACANWLVPGKGRYTGVFGGSTKTPILFVSNTRDPVTPLPNGVKASTIFKKAKLLTIDGTGHTSLKTQNACAMAKIKAYFQTGAISNSFCPLEAGPFGVTITELLLKREGDDLERKIKGLAW